MAQKPSKNQKPPVPAEEAEDLRDWVKGWQPYLVGAFIFLLGCAGWFALQVHNAQLSLGELKRVPKDIEDLTKRVTAIEVELGGLKELPTHTSNLNAAVLKASLELEQVSASTAKINAASAKLDELSADVAAVAAKQSEFKKVTDELKTSVAGIATQLQQQSEALSEVKKQLAGTSPGGPEKRLVVQHSLPDKPTSVTDVRGRSRISYDIPFQLPDAPSMGVTRVEFFELKAKDPRDSVPVGFAAEASVVPDERERQKFRVSFYSEKPQEFIDANQKVPFTVTIAIFYR